MYKIRAIVSSKINSFTCEAFETTVDQYEKSVEGIHAIKLLLLSKVKEHLNLSDENINIQNTKIMGILIDYSIPFGGVIL